MIGVGLIYEEEEEYDEVVGFLECVLLGDLINFCVKMEVVWVKVLKGDFVVVKVEFEVCMLLLIEKGQNNKELFLQMKYCFGYCIWNFDIFRFVRKSCSGVYNYFLEFFKSNFNYVLVYIIFGIYYVDYVKDKKRVWRCFQKVVEFFLFEVLFVERFVRFFVDDGDWDCVEFVVQ